MTMKKFWNWKNPIRNEDGSETPVERELEINGVIAEESWFDDDITPQMFRDELMTDDGPITVWINSVGGDCVAASQIYTMLMNYKGTVTVKINGLAASAASVIAMAGTKVLMAPTALMMIHNPSTLAQGDHRDMSKAIELLEEVKESIINAYEMKTGMSRTTLAHMMDEETWMNAKKAMQLGFADGMLTDEKKSMVEDDSFAFSAHAAVNKLVSKVKEKAGPVAEKSGRNIEELQNELTKIKKFI